MKEEFPHTKWEFPEAFLLMRRSKEFILWAFFLALCFWAGYLKGYLPGTLKQGIFSKSKVRIFNAAPFDFPRDFVLSLEQSFGQKIEIYKIRSWDDLQAKLVTKSGAHILFAPAHWSSDLSREGLIVGLSYLQSQIEKNISPDFISLGGISPQVLPLYWVKTQFITSIEGFSVSTLDLALKDKNLTQIHLLPDRDLAAKHLKSWSPNTKTIEAFSFKNPPSSVNKYSIWEVPHTINPQNTKILETSKDQALILYGFMIPKNSPNRRVSYKIIENSLEPSLQQLVLSQLHLGTTFKDSAGDLKIERNQKATEIRNLKLHEMILLEKKNLSEIQDVKLKYNFIF